MEPRPTKPRVVERPDDARRICDRARHDGLRVSLVPTMGALHEGHLALVDEARTRGELVVVSIFVNPTQFAPGEDFERYPRDLDADLAKLAERGASLVFTPDIQVIYPDGHATRVCVAELTENLCGAHRPGHFDGVTTIVAKLFNIIGPCSAVFGRKDYQQLKVIERMTRDLDLPVTVVGLPTVREPDGLALSSRNVHLLAEQRASALALARGLTAAHRLWNTGTRSVGVLRETVATPVAEAFDEVDYVTAADPTSIAPIDDSAEHTGDSLLIAVAARIGATRLIDNTVLGEDDPPVTEARDG
ncbi:MAG: pantoate--beta-alanine ligase [Deltaproteobacteria bacterium]|nr:pantoate--beta-alanine ligase [Deltaproteobacteria bacterium]